jgi:hypothetical protein
MTADVASLAPSAGVRAFLLCIIDRSSRRRLSTAGQETMYVDLKHVERNPGLP